jgi:hypothetical protein
MAKMDYDMKKDTDYNQALYPFSDKNVEFPEKGSSI